MRKNGAKCRVIAERRLDRGDAVVDLLPGALDRHPVHGERMVLAVGADGMAGVAQLADAFRKGLGHAADLEEGRLDALRGENLPESGCCCAAAARRRTSAPPRDLAAAASRSIAWCRSGDARGDRPPGFARCRARRDGRDNRRPTPLARRCRSNSPRHSSGPLPRPNTQQHITDHETPSTFPFCAKHNYTRAP